MVRREEGSMDAFDDLLAAVRELGYPDELASALSAGLDGDCTSLHLSGAIGTTCGRTSMGQASP